MVYEEQEILTVWKDYFSGLLSQKDVEQQSRRHYPSTVAKEAVYGEISVNEVEIALKKMKRGKAAGCDEVTVEMIIAAGVSGTRWTARMLNACYSQGGILEDWNMGLIVPIWKRKGDVRDPNNYRGITLLCHHAEDNGKSNCE